MEGETLIRTIGFTVALSLLSGCSVVDAAATYSNPVIDEVGPADPHVIFYEGLYYLYCTGDNWSYHVYTSPDLVNWEKGERVFAPGKDKVWAPCVFLHKADSMFYLYYSVQWDLGVAVADSPDGTFEDRGKLVDGAIDADMFEDADGNLYLYYAKDANVIWVQPMADPVTKEGEPTQLLSKAGGWEKKRTEGPCVVKHNGLYYMLYSAHNAGNPAYAVGYATADSPTGPFEKYENNPIASRSDTIFGPGHGMVIQDRAGEYWHVYHQKQADSVGFDRFICIDPMWFDESGILHTRTTRGAPYPAPVTNLPSTTQPRVDIARKISQRPHYRSRFTLAGQALPGAGAATRSPTAIAPAIIVGTDGKRTLVGRNAFRD
ncbi:MAG: family 43 glycosylhydrolase [Chitinivibrionales bacterium]|nr:family 43 glycosylhydrolase [Chitinivibrionales bacterium]